MALRTSAETVGTQIDNLNTAISTLTATPEAAVEVNGQTVTWRNIEDLINQRRALERDYNRLTRPKGAGRRRLRRVGP